MRDTRFSIFSLEGVSFSNVLSTAQASLVSWISSDAADLLMEYETSVSVRILEATVHSVWTYLSFSDFLS